MEYGIYINHDTGYIWIAAGPMGQQRMVAETMDWSPHWLVPNPNGYGFDLCNFVPGKGFEKIEEATCDRH